MSVFYNMPTDQAKVPQDPAIEKSQVVHSVREEISKYLAAQSHIGQNEVLQELLYHKNIRNRSLTNLKNSFSGKIYITDHIFHAVRHKPPGADIEFFNMQTAPDKIENSIVILGNNNVMVGDNNVEKYYALYQNSPSSIFVIWDFDNHHWISLSSVLASSCDLYIPTHLDNLDTLARFNNIMAGPIGAGTIQWPKEFLQEHLDIIKTAERSNEPLGTHIEYQQFPTRQRILQTLNKNLNKVKLVDGSYHDRPMLDRFTEWCSHKSHWVVPVLNDVPIRVFDSLITGGIPIIPRSLKYHKDIINLSDDILFYDYADIQNPHEITKKANNLFDERGIQGVLDRHYKVLYNYHVDNRVESILKAVYDEYGIPGLV